MESKINISVINYFVEKNILISVIWNKTICGVGTLTSVRSESNNSYYSGKVQLSLLIVCYKKEVSP